MNSAPIPTIIIGCGAVARQFYGPALREAERLGWARVAGLADPSELARAELARVFPGAEARAGLAELNLGEGALVIVASPPRFHREHVLTALARGWHVLCEKPMASSAAECEEMVRAATAAGRVLAVGHYKRFFPNHAWLKAVIAAGEAGPLGGLRSVRIREGGKFSWPAASDSFFRAEQTPGGVLLDIGVHVLDLLRWWLGEPGRIEYADDARGGLEANARLRAEFSPSGAGGTVAVDMRLSRDWATENVYVFRFARGEARLRVNRANRLELRYDGLEGGLEGELRDGKGRARATDPQAFIAQLGDVCAAVREGRAPAVPGAEGAQVMGLIERCYAERTALAESWRVELAGGAPLPAIAVVGASGFVGLRTVELLSAEPGAAVRPVVRAPSSLAVLARQRLDWRVANPLDEAALAEALRGCAVCVQAAMGDAGQIVRMAETAYRACARAGVRRLVWLSSASVHGQNPAVGADETERLHDGHALVYNSAKVRAERVLERLARDGVVEVVRLRPGVVFGPRSRWIADAARELAAGRGAWIEGGRGVCNSIYIDNLVAAIRLAAVHPAAAGEAFLVGDAETVTWREFLGPIAAHLGLPETAWAEVEAGAVARERESRWAALTLHPAYARLSGLVPERAKRLAKAAAGAWPAPPRGPGAWRAAGVAEAPMLSAEMTLLQQCGWKLPHAKAATRLGYAPPVPFAEGLRRSLVWLDFIRD